MGCSGVCFLTAERRSPARSYMCKSGSATGADFQSEQRFQPLVRCPKTRMCGLPSKEQRAKGSDSYVHSWGPGRDINVGMHTAKTFLRPWQDPHPPRSACIPSFFRRVLKLTGVHCCEQMVSLWPQVLSPSSKLCFSSALGAPELGHKWSHKSGSYGRNCL